jgi:hypothetical protein
MGVQGSLAEVGVKLLDENKDDSLADLGMLQCAA